jgi:hypothetical protein
VAVEASKWEWEKCRTRLVILNLHFFVWRL